MTDHRNYSKALHVQSLDRTAELLSWLQLGTCGACGRARYHSRREARRAVRVAAPGTRLRAYRCGEVWHLTVPAGHLEETGSPVMVGRPKTARRTSLDLGQRVERSWSCRRDGAGDQPPNDHRQRRDHRPSSGER